MEDKGIVDKGNNAEAVVLGDAVAVAPVVVETAVNAVFLEAVALVVGGADVGEDGWLVSEIVVMPEERVFGVVR